MLFFACVRLGPTYVRACVRRACVVRASCVRRACTGVIFTCACERGIQGACMSTQLFDQNTVIRC